VKSVDLTPLLLVWSGLAGTANHLINSFITGAGFGAAYAGITGGDILKGMKTGALMWAAGDAANMMIGHTAGFVASNFKLPAPLNGAFIYDSGEGFVTFSNVIIGPKDSLYVTLHNATDPSIKDPMGRTVLDHELGHTYPQGTTMAPVYFPAHVASLLVGGFIGILTGYGFTEEHHRFNLLERLLHPVPYPVR
jgi:hypothetical protein